MNLSIGIVGLPNVGKSTLFNALTKGKADAQNYPFCTIDPNVGIVQVPDNRLNQLEKVIPTNQLVPAVVEFVDIAGIVKGASEGEGLGNKFLANIRECDAIAEVVRVFDDKNILHVSGEINPISDIETIKTELILADIESINKRLSKAEKDLKGNPKLGLVVDSYKKVLDNMDKGIAAREISLSEKELEVLFDLNLMTLKPHIYILNVDEAHLAGLDVSKYGLKKEQTVVISAKIEAELNELSDDEKLEYLSELGQKESGLETLIKTGFDLLGLMTYFTAGEKEIKAWTIKRGWTAPQAAGVIHGDFEKGFIKAEVANYSDLINNSGWVGAKTNGKVRLEGREYVVQDGDVMIFKFNV